MFGRRNRRILEQAEFPTVIGEYATFRGDLTGAENYVIHGRVKGHCRLQGHLLLGPTAHCRGDIAAAHVVIAGEVVGDVYASVKLELHATAKISGDLISPVIAMAEGARYDGAIRMQPPLERYNEKHSI